MSLFFFPLTHQNQYYHHCENIHDLTVILVGKSEHHSISKICPKHWTLPLSFSLDSVSLHFSAFFKEYISILVHNCHAEADTLTSQEGLFQVKCLSGAGFYFYFLLEHFSLFLREIYKFEKHSPLKRKDDLVYILVYIWFWILFIKSIHWITFYTFIYLLRIFYRNISSDSSKHNKETIQ